MMKPGLAYKILLKEDVTQFAYPSQLISATGRGTGEEKPLEPTHFKTVNSFSINNAVLVISDRLLSGLVYAGDEIAAIDNANNVIGSIVYKNSSVAMTLWENEYLQKNPSYRIIIWNSVTNAEFPVGLQYRSGEAKFVQNSLSIADDLNVAKAHEKTEGDIIAYPNPVSKEVQIAFPMEHEGLVRIILTDIVGRTQVELFNSVLPKGYHSRTFDLHDLPAGQYIYQIAKGGIVKSNKLVIVR
jgi:hypothetical protein